MLTITFSVFIPNNLGTFSVHENVLNQFRFIEL